jgi:hypothetical protein
MQMKTQSLIMASLVTAALAATAGPVWSEPDALGVPEFGGREFAWNVNFWDFQLDPPPGAYHGPMKTDPAHPYNSQIQNGGLFRDGELTQPIVDTKDPVLKPWAAAQMQETNDEILTKKRGLPFNAQSRCWPGGVPGQLLFLEPVYFIQRPDEVMILWQRNSFVRRIRLADKHAEDVKPSWFGDSIGHYEGGDTLVVDTIGIKSGKNHFIDNFRTPHTDKLHVTERFTIAPDGKSLTAIVTVEDPDTFNGPLTLKNIWRRNNVAIEESVCADDGGVDWFKANLHPIPQADKPDF